MNNMKKLLGDIDPASLVDEMRQLGIKTFSTAGWSIELGSETPSPPIIPSVFEDEIEKESCLCKHPIWDHNDDGYCLHGCTDCGSPTDTGK